MAARDRVLIVTHAPERVRHGAKNLSKPPLVTQSFSDCLGFTQVIEASSKFPELYQRRVQPIEQIDGLGKHVTRLREMSEGTERLLRRDDRLAVGRPRQGLRPGLPAVAHGLVPPLAQEGMVGEPFDVLEQPVGVTPFEGGDDLCVEAHRRSRRRLA